MCFNDNGECTQLTVGYVMDKTLGNTGGLGGVYGILYAIGYGEFLLIFIWAIRLTDGVFCLTRTGLPFPEAQPWEKSFQYSAFTTFSGLTQELQKFVKGLSGGN